MRPIRLTRRVVAALAGILLVVVAAYGYWVGWAGSAENPQADAVIVHAGQRHRYRLALELMADGAAPTMVLLFASEAYREDAEEFCQDRETYNVICPEADRADTLGEAVAIDVLADKEGWESVVVVTSNYHLRRASYLDRKCTDIEILGVGAKPKNIPTRLRGVFKEMLAMPIAIGSSCR